MPRTRLILLATLFAALYATSCSHGGASDAEVQREREMLQAHDAAATAVRTASAAWSQAATAKDLDKSMSFYSDDALQLPEKAPAAAGKENIRKNWAPMLAAPGAGLSFQPTSIEVARSAEVAYEIGTYDYVTTDKKGNASDEKGKYLVVWKKQSDGSWKAAVDIDNPNQ